MMKTHNAYRICLLSLLTLVLSCPLFAATITATVSKNRVVKNEVFQLKVVVDEKVSSDEIDFTALEQDFYLGRPNFGSSLNIINGDRSDRSEWNITLAPQRLGVLTIPAFTVDGSSSTPINIEVSTDADEPQSRDLIELQSSLGKTKLYLNEFTVLQTRLIIKTNPRQLQNPKIAPPHADGLHIQAIGEPNQYQKIIDGVQVTIIDQNYRVTAQQAGTYTLSSIGFSGSTIYGSNRTGTTRLISIDTPAERYPLTVAAIPKDQKGSELPASQLTLDQQWLDSQGQPVNQPHHTMETGESLTRVIELDVQGLAPEHFPDLQVSYPNSLRLYQEKPILTQLDVNTTRMTIKQVLIAQRPAVVSLPPVTVHWWNTLSESTDETQITGLELTIEQGEHLQPEALPTNTTPVEPVKTVTVKDNGIWPYLTAMFATLWIATLIMWQRKKPSVEKPTDIETEKSNSKSQLISALQHNDTAQVNFLVKVWFNDNPDILSEHKVLIEKELSLMNSSSYAQTKQIWTADTLIALIKKIDLNKPKRSDVEPSLPHL